MHLCTPIPSEMLAFERIYLLVRENLIKVVEWMFRDLLILPLRLYIYSNMFTVL